MHAGEQNAARREEFLGDGRLDDVELLDEIVEIVEGDPHAGAEVLRARLVLGGGLRTRPQHVVRLRLEARQQAVRAGALRKRCGECPGSGLDGLRPFLRRRLVQIGKRESLPGHAGLGRLFLQRRPIAHEGLDLVEQPRVLVFFRGTAHNPLWLV